MSEPRVVVLSLIERGWQAAREFSLDLCQSGVCVVHVIKGNLSPSVRALITPAPNVRIISVHPQLFWPVAWVLLTGWWLTGRLRSLLVDNDRSQGRFFRCARLLHLNLTVVRAGAHGYELWIGPQQVSQPVWREAVARQCALP